MTEFFAATILALTLLVVESPAQAMPVQLYDHSVDYVISDLRTVCSEILFDAFDRNPYIRQHNERISVRCPQIRRCVVVDYEFNSSSANFYIYAHD